MMSFDVLMKPRKFVHSRYSGVIYFDLAVGEVHFFARGVEDDILCFVRVVC